MFRVAEDGVTHVNVYSRGSTEIGRFLTNFAHTPFVLPDDGEFASLEGYWYWLAVDDSRLRHLYGFQAKKLGKALRELHHAGRRDDFKEKILEATRVKLRTHRDMWGALVATGNLPLAHYYVVRGQARDVSAVMQFQLDEITRIRAILVARGK